MPNSYQNKAIEICFLVDVSGSMKETQAGEMTLEFLGNVIELLDGTNTTISIIGYNHSIVYNCPEIYINNPTEKAELINKIENIQFYGDTDIGLGLKEAVESFGDKKPSTDRIILLLSDGETDLPAYRNIRTIEDSQTDRNEAIQKAIQEEISIYTIGLTNRFEGNVDTLTELSSSTNAKSFTANSTLQIWEAWMELVKEYYPSSFKQINGNESTIEFTDGVLQNAGILIFSDNPQEVLSITSDEKYIEIFPGKYFSLIKHNKNSSKPLSFEIKNLSAKVYCWGIYSLYEEVSITENPRKGEEIEINFHLQDTIKDKTINEESFYKSLKVDASITRLESQETKKYSGIGEINGSIISFVPEKEGTYEIEIEYQSEFLQGKTKPISFKIINHPPAVKENLNKNILAKFGTTRIEISELFYDEDGDNLTFRLESGEEAELIGTQLEVKTSGYGEYRYQISATDNDGATQIGEIVLQSQPFWEYYRNATIFAAILLILLLGIIISYLVWRHYQKKPVELPPIKKNDPYFEGIIAGYFLTLPNEQEIEPLKWEMKEYHKKSFTIKELMKVKDITVLLLGAEKIEFRARAGKMIEVFHRSNCLVMVGSREIPKRESVFLHFGEKIYICFEDGVSEIELRYKNI